MAEHARGFPPSHRLKKRRDFLRIGERGRRLYGRRLIVGFRPAATATSRLGITVSKKVGNAVVRNRVKRWVRESWRQHPERLQRPIDIVITAKRGISDFSYQVIDEELDKLLARCFDELRRGGERPRGDRRRSGRGKKKGGRGADPARSRSGDRRRSPPGSGGGGPDRDL